MRYPLVGVQGDEGAPPNGDNLYCCCSHAPRTFVTPLVSCLSKKDWVHLLIIPGGSQCTELPLVTGMASALQEPAPVITKRSLLGAQSNVDYCQGDVSSNIITWHCTHWEISQYLINLC